MPNQVGTSQVIRFATFEVDLQAQELRKAGLRLKLSGQPFQVLAILLEQPGTVVTREELQKRLWPDTFVDVDHNLNTAINKIREALGDSSENPRFVETLPRRGYRFIAPVDRNGDHALADITDVQLAAGSQWVFEEGSQRRRSKLLLTTSIVAGVSLLCFAGILLLKRPQFNAVPPQHALTRITYDGGLQTGATWSPDGRFIAFTSDHGGKLDVWVQQVTGGNPVQVTHTSADNWQPEWSPDGKYIAYRSEQGEGGIFVIPALGGTGLERRISAFGYYPHWSPDSTRILFQSNWVTLGLGDRYYVGSLGGGEPREVLEEFVASQPGWLGSVTWHPQKERALFWVGSAEPSPNFWSVPFAKGAAILTAINPEINRELRKVAKEDGTVEHPGDFSFSWSPSGRAVYFERSYRGASNIWKMNIDAKTQQGTGIERLTAGPGPDLGIAVSHDGKRLAFTPTALHIKTWQFPFDASKARIKGQGRAVSTTEMLQVEPTLSGDGRKLAFCVLRSGRSGVWEKSFVDGSEAPVLSDDYDRSYPQWSPDGMKLAYLRASPTSNEGQIMVWSEQSRTEEPMTAVDALGRIPFDWSADARELLVSQDNEITHREEVWILPLAAAPHAELKGRKLLADLGYSFYQPHFSPNGHWIVFEAVRVTPTRTESTLYVIPAEGGAWKRVTSGLHWDDKPRWSPDGKIIYFVSRKGGVFNVWGIRFDPESGNVSGEPFRITPFRQSSLRIADHIHNVGLSVTQDQLVVTTKEESGNIWVLDGVD